MDPHTVSQDLPPSLLQRISAGAIDYVALRLAMLCVTAAWGLLATLQYVSGQSDAGPATLVVVLWLLCLAGVFVIGPARHNGRTVGQRLVGISVLDGHRGLASGGRCALRNLLLRVVPFAIAPMHTLPAQTDLFAVVLATIHYTPIWITGDPRGLVDRLLGTNLVVSADLSAGGVQPSLTVDNSGTGGHSS